MGCHCHPSALTMLNNDKKTSVVSRKSINKLMYWLGSQILVGMGASENCKWTLMFGWEVELEGEGAADNFSNVL